MRINVGSKNPVKLAAIRDVMEARFPGADFAPVAVDSGVPDQPVGLEQTLGGAMNRARAAFALSCDLAVALESGLVPMPVRQRRRLPLLGIFLFIFYSFKG